MDSTATAANDIDALFDLGEKKVKKGTQAGGWKKRFEIQDEENEEIENDFVKGIIARERSKKQSGSIQKKPNHEKKETVDDGQFSEEKMASKGEKSDQKGQKKTGNSGAVMHEGKSNDDDVEQPKKKGKEKKNDGEEVAPSNARTLRELTTLKERDGKNQGEKIDSITRQKMKTYERGDPAKPWEAEDKKVKGLLKKTEKKIKEAALAAAKNEILLTESSGYLVAEEMERTFKFKQEDIAKNVDLNSAKKYFDLKLEQFGPYTANYTRNGKYVLIGGKKGHVGAFDWKEGKLTTELHLRETVRDVTWLHNETMFAVAQKKYVYIYDNQGAEVHCLKKHLEVNKMQFLPYHFLLASIGNTGYLKYQDTSTGQLVSEFGTKLGACDVMTQNSSNAIIHLGHTNGIVTFWSPTVNTPLVKMFCHHAPLKAVAIDQAGYHMVTSGLDGELKIWDVRNYKRAVEEPYRTFSPVNSIAISQKKLLAVSFGPNVWIYQEGLTQKKEKPYLTHLLPGSIVRDITFCPFDDVLGIGHAKGFSSIIVPGAGEPNYDALEANPFETKKQRREREVKSLLEKIQPEMITLNPNFIGTLKPDNEEKRLTQHQKEFEANNPDEKFVPKQKTRGRSSTAKTYLRKNKNIIDKKRLDIKAAMEKEKTKREKRERQEEEEETPQEPNPLDRFTKKRKF